MMERPRLMDAGGARRRAQEREAASKKSQAERRAGAERVAKAAGRIPLLRTLGDIAAYSSEQQVLMSTRRKLDFPALEVSRKLSINGVFKALSHNYGKIPNVKAERHDESSVGPHFDNYADGFFPWTLLENHKGTGLIRVAFLPEAQFKAYNALAKSLPETDASDELLANTRASIGKISLDATHESCVFTGNIKPDTRILLWHGNNNTPPAVHDVQRNEPGDYTIYAIQDRGDLAMGFERIA